MSDDAYFETTRRGFCPACPGAIIPGDFLTYDERGLEVHYECPESLALQVQRDDVELIWRAAGRIRTEDPDPGDPHRRDFMLAVAQFLEDVWEDAKHDGAPAYLTRALEVARGYLGVAA